MSVLGADEPCADGTTDTPSNTTIKEKITMATRPYRSCNCREPGEPGKPGKLLGAKCPKLKTDSRHGGWFARYEAPPDAGGKRRQPR